MEFKKRLEVSTPVSGIQRSSFLGNKPSTPFKLHQNETTITVTNPERRGEILKKHTVFCIQGNDQEGTFNVIRSHDDFIKIRNLLVKRWPGCYIPSVPPKRPLTKVTEDFLESRRKEFEMFVQKMTELPHLHYSREYQVFLKSHALDQELEPFHKVAYEEIITRYKPLFREALQLRATPEAEKRIEEFRAFLQHVHSHFKVFKKVLKKTVQARKAYYEQLVLFHEVMSGGYEKDVLSRLENSMEDSKRIFFNLESRELNEKVEGVKQASQTQSIEYLYAWIKAEAREVGAFLEAIEQRDLYDNRRKKALERWSSTTSQLDKTRGGKTNLAAMITGKNRDTQIHILEGKAITQDKEAKQLQALYDVIVLVLAHTEIDRFKKRKSDQYYHVVHLAAQYELENIQNVMEYWGTIMSTGPSRKSSINSIQDNN